ncbi:MAG: hypothetical protein ACK4SX_05650 [Alcanivoracaceae bacterium]
MFGQAGHYAQSPQALVLDDRVRIYFTTRQRDRHGIYISKPAFADFSMDFSELLGLSDSELLPLGELGCFDEHGIFPFSPTVANGRILAYTTGWSRRVSVPVETSTGLVESMDGGRTFVRFGSGPVFGASLHEPYLVGDSFVRQYQGSFHMWYMFGTDWHEKAAGPPERTYKIGHAISENGIDWTKQEARQIIPDSIGPTESQALPSVLKIGERYHMVFCYRESFDFRHGGDRSYRIGYAWSDDLLHWTRDDHHLGLQHEGEWDSEMMCYPHLTAVNSDVFLLYNGNQFGCHGFGAARLVMS